jgi:hypothetical protein
VLLEDGTVTLTGLAVVAIEKPEELPA